MRVNGIFQRTARCSHAGAEAEFRIKDLQRDFKICQRCGIVFARNRVSKTWNLVGTLDEFESKIRRREIQEIVENEKRELRPLIPEWLPMISEN